jgi:hypothetical protein
MNQQLMVELESRMEGNEAWSPDVHQR